MAADAILTVDALSLLRAAKIWQTERIFRLVMLRKRNGQAPDLICRTRAPAVTLADIPLEVLSILLLEVRAVVIDALSQNWPYSDGCRCHPYRPAHDSKFWAGNQDFVLWLLNRQSASSKQIAVQSSSFTPGGIFTEGGVVTKRLSSLSFSLNVVFDAEDVQTWLKRSDAGKRFLSTMRDKDPYSNDMMREGCNVRCHDARLAILRSFVVDSVRSDRSYIISRSLCARPYSALPTYSALAPDYQYEARTFLQEHSLCQPTHHANYHDGFSRTCHHQSGYYSQCTRISLSLSTSAARLQHWQKYFDAFDVKHERHLHTRDRRKGHARHF